MVDLIRSVELEPDAGAPAHARRLVLETLTALGCTTDVVERARLCTSELVTNAVLHARTPLELRVVRDGDRVRVEVVDGSDLWPTMRDAVADDESGRGLLLMKTLATRWGAEVGPAGKLVWFELRAGG